ncbi:hypothetical protein GDO86_012182, partial [Hymenochirus boettgeri]
ISLFFVLGYSLSCTTCVSLGNSPCEGQSETCPPDYVCGSTYTSSKSAGGTVSETYTTSCLPRSQCSGSGSVSIPNGKVKRGVSCCYTDNCAPSRPNLSADNDIKNGHVCPTCISDTTWCEGSDTMECTGEENKCLMLSTKISGISNHCHSLRGCSTKSICDLGSNSVKTMDLAIDVKFTCNNGGFRVRQGSFLVVSV